MRTVPLGVNVEGLRRRRRRSTRSPFTIGYFARVAPEKGLHNLAEAYRILRQERGLAAVAARRRGLHGRRPPGVSRRHPAIAGVVRGSADEFEYFGTVDRDSKARFLQSIDVLSVPSGYHEPKGLYLLEAMASGVPVVQPNHGAFPEMLRTHRRRSAGDARSGRRTSRTRSWSSGAIRRGPRRSARAAPQACARAYTIDQHGDGHARRLLAS